IPATARYCRWLKTRSATPATRGQLVEGTSETAPKPVSNAGRNIAWPVYHASMPKIFPLIALGTVLLFSAVPVVFAEAVVPGIASSQLDPELKGLVLIEELNCAACHASDAALAARSKKAPRLSEVGSRVN